MAKAASQPSAAPVVIPVSEAPKALTELSLEQVPEVVALMALCEKARLSDWPSSPRIREQQVDGDYYSRNTVSSREHGYIIEITVESNAGRADRWEVDKAQAERDLSSAITKCKSLKTALSGKPEEEVVKLQIEIKAAEKQIDKLKKLIEDLTKKLAAPRDRIWKFPLSLENLIVSAFPMDLVRDPNEEVEA